VPSQKCAVEIVVSPMEGGEEADFNTTAAFNGISRIWKLRFE
jgi:hypothetical protein